jgi:integrase
MAVSRSTIKLDEYLDESFATARQSLRPTTARGYAQSTGRLSKALGNYQLQTLTPMKVQRCCTELLESGGHEGKPLVPKTVRHAHVVLRKALADAERVGLVSRNAAPSARPPAGEHAEMTTWSSEDLRNFLAAIEAHPYEIGFRLLAATGLRRGEVLGLRWRDVDFDLGQIAVANTIAEIGAETVMAPPKRARSRRNVYLDRRTVAALREHRQRQRERRIAAGPAWDADRDWVFTDELGGFRTPAVDLLRVAQADRAARPGEDSPARPAPHPRGSGIEGGRRSEGRVRAARPRHRGHHARSVLPRRPFARQGPLQNRS